ncbi:MAG: hypothetical protein SVM80_04135 [Halobacteriota archaeon]|nr:hypothetical protein [Halobacteriota archaeon]
MKSIVSFSNKRNPKEASKGIMEDVHSRLEFEPDLALFYATQKYHGNYQTMLETIGEEFGDLPQIGASIDGMVYPDDIRADGAALILCHDPDAKIDVKGLKVKGAIKTAEKLADKVSCKEGTILLHFPVVHVPTLRDGIEFYARGAYYSQRCKGKDIEKQKSYASSFSDYCDRKNIFYPPPTILNKFAEKTNYKVPIVGINVLHTQMKLDSPNIFCNFNDIDGGIAALTIEKDDINVIYDDIFPDKGKTLEETMKIVRDKFRIVEEYNAVFEKNVLISLDGEPPVDAVKDNIFVSNRNENKLVDKLEKGSFEAQIPYGLAFFNEGTRGMTITGIGSYYPFDMFPFFADLSGFSEKVLLVHESFYGKLSDFISSMYQIEHPERFNLLFMDQGSISAFGNKVYELTNEIKNVARDNYFGVISASPSVYLPKDYQRRSYIPESDQNIFSTAAGTNICLEI